MNFEKKICYCFFFQSKRGLLTETPLTLHFEGFSINSPLTFQRAKLLSKEAKKSTDILRELYSTSKFPKKLLFMSKYVQISKKLLFMSSAKVNPYVV